MAKPAPGADQPSMNSSSAFAIFLGLGLCGATLHAQVAERPSPVTDTRRVSTGGGKTEVLRKINGRWWSQDNREVNPPSKTGVFWVLDSKPGVVDFYHHRPCSLGAAESLRLFMQPSEVEALLGPPNRIFGKDPHAFWYYYAVNGTILRVRFMGEGDGLGEAEYDPVTGKSFSVRSIEEELGGRSIYRVLADRATQRSAANRGQASLASSPAAPYAPLSPRSHTRASQPRVVAVAADNVTETVAARQSLAPKRMVTAEALATVVPGASREEVVARLGTPSSKSAIAGSDGLRESMTYHRESESPVVVRLLNGKVTEVVAAGGPAGQR